jgi:hypothetical protein
MRGFMIGVLMVAGSAACVAGLVSHDAGWLFLGAFPFFIGVLLLVFPPPAKPSQPERVDPD